MKNQQSRPGFKSYTLFALLGGGMIIMLFWRLESAPPIWWDEGWNVSVARIWAESGWFARLRDGELYPARMNGAPSIVLASAASFRLFGVGIWQARLPFVIITIGALAAMYAVSRALYGRKVAMATLFVLILMSGHREIHPIIMGRQALGETLALLFLLAGYWSLLHANRRRPAFVLLAAISFGLAANTKLQVQPFLLVSLLLSMAYNVYRRRTLEVALSGATLVGTALVFLLLRRIPGYLNTVPGDAFALDSLVRTTAVVFAWPNRVLSLVFVVVFGLPTVIALAYTAYKIVARRSSANDDAGRQTVIVGLWGLAASWMAWYSLLSVGWLRYMFPATYLSSIFVASMLSDLSNGFQIGDLWRRFRVSRYRLRDNRAFVAILMLLVLTLPAGINTMYRVYWRDASSSVVEVARYIDSSVPRDALIETYETELFFLLDHRYHYPPDSVVPVLNRSMFMGSGVDVGYDPLQADPDYLVVGPFAKLSHLYDAIIEEREFRLEVAFPGYDLYRRIR